MRPQHLIAAAAAALLATACSAAPDTSAAASSPSSAPTGVVRSAGGDTDPACSSEEVEDVLSGLQAASKRGVFDIPPRARLGQKEVGGWHWSLRRLESEAGPKLKDAATAARDVMGKWLAAQPGSDERDLYRTGIKAAASTVAITCKQVRKYPFVIDGV